MPGVEYRLREFLPPADQRALLVDASAGLALGALPGLEHFSEAVTPLRRVVDGLVCSPGQIGKLSRATQADAGLLVRMDWSNSLRDASFVLPPMSTQRVPLLSAEDALELGACGMVTTFLLGYEEEIEAGCLRSTVQLALCGRELGLPLVVEVQPGGPRVSVYGKAVELGASYALEGGADVIVVPHPGLASLETLGKFVSVPWLVKPTGLDTARQELAEALAAGACGLWLDHTMFGRQAPRTWLDELHQAVHVPHAAPVEG